MESSSSCNIELKVMYAKDVTAFNFFQPLNVYVVVSIINKDHPEKVLVKEQRTAADKEGDGNPEWNHEMKFDLNHHDWLEDYKDLFLLFSFKHEGVMFGDKDIGEVHVPFTDLIQEFNGILRFVNYEIRSPEGKPNGMLNFSYKVNGKRKDHNFGIGSGLVHITGYQHHHHHHHHDHHNDNHQSVSERIQYPSFDQEETTTTLYSVSQHDHSLPAQPHHHQSQDIYPPPNTQPFLPPPPEQSMFPHHPLLPPPPPEQSMFPHHPLLPPPPPPPPPAMSNGVCYYPPYPYPPSPRAYPPPWGTNPNGYGTYGAHHHGQY
ncbi:hypothetical protein ACFE04_006336 [Oxalis oulophora]